jgi:hypothetical protein
LSSTVTAEREGLPAPALEPAPGAVELDTTGLSIDEVVASPFFLYGSVERIAEMVAELRERYGIGYLRVPEDQMAGFAPVIAKVSSPA